MFDFFNSDFGFYKITDNFAKQMKQQEKKFPHKNYKLRGSIYCIFQLKRIEKWEDEVADHKIPF